MNILFHVGVGNKDRPERWTAIGGFFNDLGDSLEKLGHKCAYFCHSAATQRIRSNKLLVSDEVHKINDINPDIIFTWNGISEGDQKMIEIYGREKFIFAELGFFDHYSTCYFDACGTNFVSMNVVENLDNVELDNTLFESIQKKYIKPRLHDKNYIFVPLQDEGDTQIQKLSPFKTMYQLLDYVLTIYTNSNVDILYKPHPQFSPKIPKSERLIKVSGDVHSYIPYADKVIGINSTVLFETLLYHQRVITCGIGLPSRRFLDDNERKKFIINCYNKQMNQSDLDNVNVIKTSWLYKEILRRSNLVVG